MFVLGSVKIKPPAGCSTSRQGTLLCTKTEVRLAQTFPNLRRLNDYPRIGKNTCKPYSLQKITAEVLRFGLSGMFFGVRIPPTVVLYLQISTNFGNTFSKLAPMVVVYHTQNDTNISNSRHELQVDNKNQSMTSTQQWRNPSRKKLTFPPLDTQKTSCHLEPLAPFPAFPKELCF